MRAMALCSQKRTCVVKCICNQGSEVEQFFYWVGVPLCFVYYIGEIFFQYSVMKTESAVMWSYIQSGYAFREIVVHSYRCFPYTIHTMQKQRGHVGNLENVSNISFSGSKRGKSDSFTLFIKKERKNLIGKLDLV